ncbi:MAG: type II toxin-antitoxin system RelE/ParE family toxin [Vitreimonas sp.]
MPEPLHTVAETPEFLRKAAAAGMGEEERGAIVRAIAANPKAGDLVPGSGGVFKRRFAGRGRGKSGGYRTMVAYLGPDAPAYALSLLSTGERDNSAPPKSRPCTIW